MKRFSRFAVLAVALSLVGILFTSPALAAGKPAPTSKINLNSATAQQLTALPGVGPKLPASIASPNLLAYSEEAHILGAGKAFEKEFTKVRLTAIKSSAYAAIRFEDCPGGPCYSEYLDKNWNGILSTEIASGKDVRIGGPF